MLSPVALAACVGGFFFTKAVVRELREFADPGPHELIVDQPCTVDDGRVTFTGTIRNLDDETHDYRIVVEFFGIDEHESRRTRSLCSMSVPGETAPWSSSVEFDESSVECKVTDVFGPPPFDFDQD